VHTAGFLSLDTDGRVVRVDTLAKLLGPGFRLGWLSGPPPLVAKLGLYMAGISIGANMVSQVSRKGFNYVCSSSLPLGVCVFGGRQNPTLGVPGEGRTAQECCCLKRLHASFDKFVCAGSVCC
jgi:hypothetical protein